MNFHFLTGDTNWQEYGGKFVSKKLNNGDWDYWCVLNVTNMWEATGEEDQPKYNVSLEAVSPIAAGQANLDSAFSSAGFDDAQLEQFQQNPLVQVEVLSDYGIYAPLWNESGNNLKVLLKLAHKEAIVANMLFGFYMDRPKNRIGNTGWDCIAGEIGFK